MTRFDKTAASRFLVAVRAGASNAVAAQHADVPLNAARDWLRGGTPVKDEFRSDVRKARSDLELVAVGHVRGRMAEDPAAAMWVADKVQGDAEFERLRDLTT